MTFSPALGIVLALAGSLPSAAPPPAGAVRAAAPLAAPCRSGAPGVENGIPVVEVCGGTFSFGAAPDDPLAADDERPAREVTVKSFQLARTETTNAQMRRFRPDHPGEDELPASGVSWPEARAACAHFGGRLPTEAEWELAARAGSSTRWWFGEEHRGLAEVAWFAEAEPLTGPRPVAGKKASPWGLYDLLGNVCEWVEDAYDPYPGADRRVLQGIPPGERRVCRGGSFANAWRLLRPTHRSAFPPELRFPSVGFRCAWAPG